MKETIKNCVYEILNNEPLTREDDNVLIAEILKKQNRDNLTQKEKQILINIFLNWRKLKLPNRNSIIRVRRFLQVKHPHLINERAHSYRKCEEEEYYKTYKNN